MSSDRFKAWQFLDQFNETVPAWYQEADVRRKAMASTVVCFETSDPSRVEQFLRLKRQQEEFFVYDRWNGLSREGVSPQGGSRFADEPNPLDGSSSVMGLDAALRRVDACLRETRGGHNAPDLVLKDLVELRTPDPQDWSLVDALRAWALDPKALTVDFTVYAFTPSVAIFDERTRRHFIVVPIEVSSPKERQVVIEHEAGGAAGPWDQLVEMTRGLDIRELDSALIETRYLSPTGGFDTEFIKQAKARLIKTSGFLELEEPKHGFNKVGGYSRLKEFLGETVVRPHKEGAARARFLQLAPPRGILLFGPQGTGKTLLAKALAREVDLPFINFRTENIYSQYLGVSGQVFAQAVKLIEALSPAIVFIDEIDRFGKRYESRDSAGEETRRVFSQMLEWLGDESRRSIVIGTTNQPGHLDKAFYRPGRFDYKIPMGFPDREARREILLLHLGRVPASGIDPVPIEMEPGRLARLVEDHLLPGTDLFKGAELEQFVTRCKRKALRRDAGGITEEDIRSVLAEYELDRDVLELTKKEFLHDVKQFADDASLISSD